MTQPLRDQLVERLRALVIREEKISRHLHGEDGRLDADFGDIANFVASDEVLEGLEDAALEEIRQIRGALARMEAGSYGVCVGCGDQIPSGRLQIVPFATRCVGCAA